MEGRMCWAWQTPGLLLHPVPSSHVAVVMSSLRGLAENQKLHKLPPKPVGCHSSPPNSVLLGFITSAFDLLHLEWLLPLSGHIHSSIQRMCCA